MIKVDFGGFEITTVHEEDMLYDALETRFHKDMIISLWSWGDLEIEKIMPLSNLEFRDFYHD